MRSHTGYVRSLNCFLDKLETKGYICTEERKQSPNVLSYETIVALRHNGCVWPLYYILNFTKKGSDKSFSCKLAVITNESGGNYGYDYEGFRMRWKTVKDTIEKALAANL